MVTMNGMKERLQNAGAKICGGAAYAIAYASTLPVRAEGTMTIEKVELNSEGASDPGTIIGQVLGIILYVANFLGSALILWGLVMFGLSIKNDEPESKTKALMCTFAGVLLFSLRFVLKMAGIISG